MPAQETVRASFFMRRDGGARRGLFAGRFVYGMVCLRDCLRDCLRGGLPAGRTVCGSGIFSRTRSGPEPGNRTGKQGNREAGNRGRKSGRLVVSGQWSDRSASRRPVCRPDVSGAGRMAFFAFAEIFTADFLHRAQ